MQKFANNLQIIAKRARRIAGLTIAGAAMRSHVSPRSLGYYEAGRILPPPDVVKSMAIAYRNPELAEFYCHECCPLGDQCERRECA